jgi:hypothetical protein
MNKVPRHEPRCAAAGESCKPIRAPGLGLSLDDPDADGVGNETAVDRVLAPVPV